MTLLGLGTAPIYAGGFIAAPLYAAGNSPISVAAGDFNRDGISDLAVVNQKPSYSTDPDTISVLLGNGDGTFAGPFSYAVDSNPHRSPWGTLTAMVSPTSRLPTSRAH